MERGSSSRVAAAMVVAAVVVCGAAARASDGVVEINQAKALAGGINGSLVADPPGLPVTITASGSYRLTGSLATPAFNVVVIQIDAPHVVLDLGGFAITGPNQCAGGFGVAVTCTTTGQSAAIQSTAEHVVVRGGTVSGAGGSGVLLEGVNSGVRDLLAEHNGGYGIRLGFAGEVSHARASLNSGIGIRASDSSRIHDSTVERSGADGISAGSGAVLGANASHGNVGNGIACSQRCAVAHNATNSNGSHGIVAAGTIEGNAAANNTSAGIRGPTSTIRGNTVTANGLCGIDGSPGELVAAVGSNRATGNGTSAICGGAQITGVAIDCNLVVCTPPTLPALFCPGNLAPTCS